MRSLNPFDATRVASFVVAMILVACGGSTSSDLGKDGGSTDGGCPGDPPPLHCVGGCGEVADTARCIDGSWQCPAVSNITCAVDSGAIDASEHDAGTIICDTTTCNANTEYCDVRGGGVPLLDAGSNFSAQCLPLPAMPCDAGTGCDCIPNKCSCTDNDGAIKNECLYP